MRKQLEKIGVKGKNVMGLSCVHCALYLHCNGRQSRVNDLVSLFGHDVLARRDSNAIRLISLEADGLLSRDVLIGALLRLTRHDI